MSTREGGVAANLLGVLADPDRAPALQLAEWDALLRVGRRARLLGTLHARLEHRPDLYVRIPACVLGHLRAASHYAAHRRQNLLIGLDALSRALPAELPVVLLKGSAYVLQELALADGRLPGDIDLLVRREHLAAAEQALQSAGWRFHAISAYDERYYREWSHELPPLRRPGDALEVDLHHGITPTTARVRPDEARLFREARPVGGCRWSVLHPHDQIIHAALHLFQDSDFADSLRGVVDIDGLVRAHLHEAGGWPALIERARAHGALHALWYALECCRRWLGLTLPDAVQAAAPPRWRRRLTLWAFTHTALPIMPDRAEPGTRRLARAIGLVRYHWLRMPPHLLARHLTHKALQRLWPRRLRRGAATAPR
jgi:hypothetical protein